MLAIKIQIARFVDFHFPGWVECKMADAHGHEHLFVDKVPVVTSAVLDEASLPQPGFIGCVVVGEKKHGDGRRIVIVDTHTPWGIESTSGGTRFEVWPDQLAEIPRGEGSK